MTSVVLSDSIKYCFITNGASIGGGDALNFRYKNADELVGGDRLSSGDGGSTWNVISNEIYFVLHGGGKFLITRTTDNDLYQAVLTKVT